MDTPGRSRQRVLVRPSALASLALVLLLPRAAEGCCIEGWICFDRHAWAGVSLLNEAPVPRDGVLVFSAWTSSDLCTPELASFVTVEVRRGDQPLAGELELVDGWTRNFLWRPEQPWEPGAAHSVRITVDNPGLSELEPGSESPLTCPTDVQACQDTLVFEQEFSVALDVSPPLPPLPAPELSLKTSGLGDTAFDVACCPGAEPGVACASGCGCGVFLGDGECAWLYEQRRLAASLPSSPQPPGLAHQILFELRAGDEVVDRARALGDLAVVRNTAACFEVVALHLGNGQTAASDIVCPSDQLTQQLGVHPTDIAALACDAPLRCAVGEFDWDPAACVAHDPLSLPPPPPDHPDDVFDAPCPIAQGPWLSPGPADEPTSGAPDDPSTTDLPEDPLVDHGCGCDGSLGPSLPLLLVPLLVRRRRLTG